MAKSYARRSFYPQQSYNSHLDPSLEAAAAFAQFRLCCNINQHAGDRDGTGWNAWPGKSNRASYPISRICFMGWLGPRSLAEFMNIDRSIGRLLFAWMMPRIE